MEQAHNCFAHAQCVAENPAPELEIYKHACADAHYLFNLKVDYRLIIHAVSVLLHAYQL